MSVARDRATESVGSDRALDEAHGVANRLDGFGGVIGDLDPELFLEGHNQLDGVEAVGTQIVDERSGFDHLVFVNARCSTTIFFTRSAISLMSYPHSRGHPPIFCTGKRPDSAQGGSPAAKAGDIAPMNLHATAFATDPA